METKIRLLTIDDLPFLKAMQTGIEDDYVIARRFMRGGEFFEGVRAMLVDKDKSPKWVPETLDKVTETAVSAHFEPLPGRLSEGFKG